MTENNTTAGANEEPVATPQFAVQRIYLKDLSFETPMGAAVFQKQVKPEVNQDISLSTTKLSDHNYEVELTLTVTVKNGDETIYLVEAHQAGIFKVSGIEGPQLAQVLNTICPTTLFPYAREVIDNVVVKGSFPALMIPPINFEALFAEAMAKGDVKTGQPKAESITH